MLNVYIILSMTSIKLSWLEFSCFYFLVIPLYCLSAICDYIPYIFENGRISYLHSL